jgi:hypothetical protein
MLVENGSLGSRREAVDPVEVPPATGLVESGLFQLCLLLWLLYLRRLDDRVGLYLLVVVGEVGVDSSGWSIWL